MDDQEPDDRSFLRLEQGQPDAEGPDPRVGRIGEDLEADQFLARLAVGVDHLDPWRGRLDDASRMPLPSRVSIKASMACRPLAESGTIGIGSGGTSQPDRPIATKITITHQDRLEGCSTSKSESE